MRIRKNPFGWLGLLFLIASVAFLLQKLERTAGTDRKAAIPEPPREAFAAPVPANVTKGPVIEPALLQHVRDSDLTEPDAARWAVAKWPGATLVRARSSVVGAGGLFRRVAILKPADLPYHIRIEEILRQDVDGNVELVAAAETVADHILVQRNPDDDDTVFEAALAAVGYETTRRISARGLWRIGVSLEDLDAVPDGVEKLATLAAVSYSEADNIVRSFATPNDPRYLDGKLWGLHNTGQDGGTADADIDAPEGWAMRTDASGVVVGVIDTGISIDHEDLVDNLWVNPNETADGADTDGNGFIDDLHGINAIQLNGDPSDDQGHGSHCAGTIGARGNNGVGVTGVAWNVRLMGLKFLSSAGGGASSDAVTCIDYGVENGAQILSNSWGGGGFSQAILDAVEAARDAGVIFVVAAGNSSTDNDTAPIYPASLPVDNVVAVASTTRTDALSPFSCYGQGSVDIGAPGSDVLSIDHESQTGYKSLSGTSMATPHVAGTLALLRAEFPSDTWAGLIHRLYRGGDITPALSEGKVATGRRLNLQGAMSAPTNRHPHDDFATPRVLHGDRVVLRTTLRGATAESGQPNIHGASDANTIWFSFTPAAPGLTSVTALASESIWNPMNGQTTTITYDRVPALIGVFTGDTLGSLVPVGSGEDAATFTASAGATYRIAVAGQGGAEGLLMLDVTGAPANSSLATAASLTLGTSLSGTTRNALSEPGEPAHAGQTASASVWYKWTANVTGRVAFTTRGSDFDTIAAVYSGPATSPGFASLVPVDSNDNETGRTTSRVEFNIVAATTYYFAVDGKAGATGNVAVTVAVPPANDHFSSPVILPGTDITRNITTSYGSREPGEPIPYPGQGRGESLWFSWTAPENGRTTLDLAGSFFPGLIAVYTGNAIDSLSLVTRDGAGNRFAQVTFEATRGTTYRILVDAWDRTLFNVPLRLRMVPTPANDSFADATEIQGLRATVVGSNVGSTREAGEPSAGNNGGISVWHKWTAPATGTYGIYGERLNKPDQWMIVLNVFTGSAVDALTHVKEDQQNGIGRDAFARFPATAGTTYHIQVTGLTANGILGGVGPYRLDLHPVAEHAPDNDSFTNAVELDGSTVFNFRTQNYGASSEPGEGTHSTYEAFRTLWWKFAVPPGMGGKYSIATTLSEGDVGTTIYRANDPNNPTLGALTQVASNVEFANQNFPDVTWQAEEGQVYYIVSDNYGGGLGRVVFNFQKVPDNITFANAKVIPAEGLSEITYNLGSVREAGEPTGGFGTVTAGHRSLWWIWTAPASGRYQADTIGSRLGVAEDRPISRQFGSPTILGLNTALGVYTGYAVNALSTVVTNGNISGYSNSPWSFQRNSRVEFDATAGTTYRIMVNANALGTTAEEREQNTHLGEIHFKFSRLDPPANDAFADATEITGPDHSTITTNFGATKQAGEPNHGGLTNGRTLWWKWTAPETGRFIVSTAGNMYDDYNARRTGLGVYTGSTVNSLSTVASNQNGAGVSTGDYTWSAVSFNAVAGTTYHFGVDSVFAGNLSFLLTRPAPNDNFANATVMQGSRWFATGHNLLATVEPGETKIEWFGNPPPVNDTTVRSVWWRWTAPVSGAITIDTLGSQNYNVIGVYTGGALGALAPVIVTANSGDFLNGEGPNRSRSGTKRVAFDAVAGTAYHITVQGAGYTAASSGPISLALDGPPAVPFAPEDFAAIRTGAATIGLAWTDVAVDEEYYEIERSSDGVSWALLHETPPDVISHTDITATEGSDYYYRIRAANSVGESAWVTAAVTVPQPPPAPSGLTVTALSPHDISITWFPAPTASSHRLERSLDAGNTWNFVATLGTTAGYYTEVGLTPSTVHYYRVRASNELGDGPWATASGMTPALGSLSLSYPESTYAETAGSFTATVTRSGTSGAQTVFLSSGSTRLTVPAKVVIPDGQSSATFEVIINGADSVNPTDTATITAFAPDALIGESFTGSVDAAVNTQNTGWGWSGSWYSNNTPAVLVEPSLTYNKNGTIGTPGTRAIRLNSSGGTDARRFFATKYTSGDIWVSTLLHRNSSNWQTQMIIRENTGGGINASVTYENATNHWRLKTSTGADAPLLASNPSGQIHYIVMRFDFNNRQIHAWFSPEASGSAPTGAVGSATVAMPEALTGISRLDLFGYSVLDGFDEIRVANSFANLHGGATASRSIRLVDEGSLTPLEQWRRLHFGSIGNAGDGADLNDFDRDGIVNLLEYALGGNPRTPSASVLPTASFTEIDGSLYLTLTVGKNPEATDVTFAVETSVDLAEWKSGAGHTVVMLEDADELRVRASAPRNGESKRFIRLRVTR